MKKLFLLRKRFIGQLNYYLIGLEDKANNYAKILGYNYNSGKWFEQSYKILNKDYKIIKKSQR